MQSLTSPWKSKNQLHASIIQWHRISILIPKKKRTGGHSEKILNQSKTKTSMIHTKSCSSMFSFKGFGWLPLQHRCLQHRYDSAVRSLRGGWLRALVPHHSTSHWPLHGLLAETPSLPHVAWLAEAKKEGRIQKPFILSCLQS